MLKKCERQKIIKIQDKKANKRNKYLDILNIEFEQNKI